MKLIKYCNIYTVRCVSDKNKQKKRTRDNLMDSSNQRARLAKLQPVAAEHSLLLQYFGWEMSIASPSVIDFSLHDCWMSRRQDKALLSQQLVTKPILHSAITMLFPLIACHTRMSEAECSAGIDLTKNNNVVLNGSIFRVNMQSRKRQIATIVNRIISG